MYGDYGEEPLRDTNVKSPDDPDAYGEQEQEQPYQEEEEKQVE